jgi:hypothetical protein
MTTGLPDSDRDALLGELVRCRTDPVRFIERWLGIDTLWRRQVEIIEALRDHRKVAVASCHEFGKTYIAAAAAIWFFVCHWPSLVVTTAPGGRQTESLLWAHIRSMKARARFELPGQVGATSWKLASDPRSFMIGFSTSTDRAHEHASKFTGFHSENLLLVFDEAGGIAKPIWDAAHGLMTSGHVRWLAIGNPADPAGEFARAFHSGDWHAIHVDAYETPNISAGENVLPYFPSIEWLEEMRKKCGPDYERNAEFQFKVRGIFPTAGVDTLISVGDFQIASTRRAEAEPDTPATMGVDVARFGDDRTVLCVVRGPKIVHVEAYGRQDTVFTAGRVTEVAERFAIYRGDAWRIAVDDTGVGGGVVDMLRARGWAIRAVNFGEKAERHEDTCANRRTELWVGIRDWIRDDAALADLDDATRLELKRDLTTVKYKFLPDGRRALEPKADLKKRIGRSPDYADALGLALVAKVSRGRWVPPLDLLGGLHPGCTDRDPCGDQDCPACRSSGGSMGTVRRLISETYGRRGQIGFC